MFYDTHAHFVTPPLETVGIMNRATEAQVTRLVAVGGSDELNTGAIAVHCAFPETTRLALGADRDQAGDDAANTVALDTLRLLMRAHPCHAVGEAGLDYCCQPDTSVAQRDLFARQLALADELNLPIIIHTRQADDDTLGVLDDVPWRGNGYRGVIHCFTGSPAFAQRLLDRQFMISISGIVTFKNADLVRESAAYIPADRLLIETDAPWLAPVPLRGKVNEPAYLVHTAQCVATLRKVASSTLAEQTFANAQRLFG